MAVGIHTITTESVHKSDFALVGHAVPLGAFAAFIGSNAEM